METIMKPIGQTTLKSVITGTLLDIGVSPGLLGYVYIKTAVELVYQNEAYLRGITKSLYPEIASRHNSTPSRVERAIRHAVEKMYDDTDCDVLARYFGNVCSARSGKVTNTTFIAVIVESIRLRMEEVGKENPQ